MADKSEAFIFHCNGDTPSGAVIITQGDRAIYYECPNLDPIIGNLDEVILRTMCSTQNGAKVSKDGIVGDLFIPEKQFAFTQIESIPTRYQHGDMRLNLIESGILTTSSSVYFDPAKPDWMFKNGVRTIVSIDSNKIPRTFSTFAGTFRLIERKNLEFPELESGRTVGPL
jgi:hypothetical protein